MKFKFYFRSFTLALASVFLAIGCTPDKPIDQSTPGSISFDLQVKNVMPGEATLSVMPNDNTVSYFFGAMTKAQFDEFSSEAAFVEAEAVRVLALAQAQQMTPVAYLQANAKKGAVDVKLATAVPLTAYYAYVYALDATGKTSSILFKVAFTSGEAVKAAPVIELTMIPGDLQGLDKDTRMTIGGKSSGVTSGRILLALKSELDDALASGITLTQILDDDRNGTPFDPSELVALNGEGGWKYPFRGLSPGTEYTTVVKVTNAIGSTIETITESTLAHAGNNAPPLDLVLSPGDISGENKNTCMTVMLKSTGAMAGRYGLFLKSAVEAALEAGYTLAELIDGNGTAFVAEQLLAINSAEGYTISVDQLDPGKAYTFMAKAASLGGTSVLSKSLTMATGIGPVLSVSVIPGDTTGQKTDVNLLVTIKSQDVNMGRHTLMTKADFDAQIAEGKSPAQILTANSIAINSGDIAALRTPAGMRHVFTALSPSTAYKHIVEVDNDNGRSYEYTNALTEAGFVPTSKMTFEFEIEDLGSTAATLMIVPSISTETYYYDYLEVSQYDKLSDAEWIAKLIGDKGIAGSILSTGRDGLPYDSFGYLPLTANTEYYLYAFGYDEVSKSATTRITKQKFTTRPANEPSTSAYAAWIGQWTVTSASSEKNATPISMDIEVSEKVNNVSYGITGWGITSHRAKNITAALTADGGLSIKNKQAIGNLTDGTLCFVGRYYNALTGKYAMAVAPIDALIGSLSEGGLTATVVGGTFSVTDTSGVTRENTVTAMDYFNNKTVGNGWFGYGALKPYTDSGYGVAPYTLTKVAAFQSRSGRALDANVLSSPEYKLHMAKRVHVKQALAAKLQVAVKSVVELPVNVVCVKASTVLNLSVVDVLAPRFSVTKINAIK